MVTIMNYRALPSLVAVSSSGIALFAFEQRLIGYGLIALGLMLSLLVSHRMFRDISLIAFALVMVNIVPINTDISYSHMSLMGLALSLAVGVPYLVSRFVYKDYSIKFPFHFREPWGRAKWFYISLVGIVGYFVLPIYMINTGVYLNWPAVDDTSSIVRLFIGTNALGIWDELFFICTVFVIFHRYVPFWVANILQAALFTSFLYELGFESYGPILIYVFALTQGYIFKITHSLFYLLCIHLLFDFILFLVLVHAHNPTWIDIFIY